MPSTAGIVNSGSRGSRVELIAASGTTLAGWTWYGGGFGTKYTFSGTTPANTIAYLTFSKSGNAFVTNWASSPQYIAHAYAWSSNGFGTKYADTTTVISSLRCRWW
jgi:hypothetical protein